MQMFSKYTMKKRFCKTWFQFGRQTCEIMVPKQGRDESVQEGYPTINDSGNEREEDYPIGIHMLYMQQM